MESECIRPPIPSHPDYLPNKTRIQYTSHCNDVVTKHLGAKVILSRSLLTKKNDYELSQRQDETKWQNPYESLIGERIPIAENEFEVEDYLQKKVRYS